MDFNILKKIKSSFRYGKGMKCFEKKNFNMAIGLFEWVLKNESNKSVLHFARYYLGRSYFATGKNKEAIDNFSYSYDFFLKRIRQMNKPSDLYYYKNLAAEYIQALDRDGQENMAEKIRIDRDHLLGWKKESGSNLAS